MLFRIFIRRFTFLRYGPEGAWNTTGAWNTIRCRPHIRGGEAAAVNMGALWRQQVPAAEVELGKAITVTSRGDEAGAGVGVLNPVSRMHRS